MYSVRCIASKKLYPFRSLSLPCWVSPLWSRSLLTSCNSICQTLVLFPKLLRVLFRKPLPMPLPWSVSPNCFRVYGLTLKPLICFELIFIWSKRYIGLVSFIYMWRFSFLSTFVEDALFSLIWTFFCFVKHKVGIVGIVCRLISESSILLINNGSVVLLWWGSVLVICAVTMKHVRPMIHVPAGCKL